MANLISIDDLEITNFGPFYGTTRFDFLTDPDGPPHVLIGGKNGAGKTHVLRAMYLAVAGSAGIGDLRKVETGSDANRFNFDRVLNRRAAREGEDKCTLKATIRQRDADSGKEQILTLHREIRFRPASPPVWHSWAERSNDMESVTEETLIERLRDAFLPRHLARFFFFDAEKSQNVQLGDTDIVKGVSRILGLWAYERLEHELSDIYSNTNRQLNSTGGNEALEKLTAVQGDITALRGKLQSNEAKSRQRREELQEAENKLAEIEDQLKTLGAVDPAKLQQDQQTREKVADAKREIERQLESVWEVPMPVALLAGLRGSLIQQLQGEETKRSWLDQKQAIEPRLPAIKADVFESPAPEHVLPAPTHDYYSTRLSKALEGLFHPPPDGVEGIEIFVCDRPETNFSVRQILAAQHSDLQGIEDSCRKLEVLEQEWKDLEYQIRQQSQNIAAIGAGKELHELRAALKADIKRLEAELVDLANLQQQNEAEMVRLKVEETRWSEAETAASKGRSLASRAHAYREAASLMRKRASEQMRKQINQLVSDLWLEITDRGHEFRGLEFTGDLWQCELIRRNGNRITWDDANTSAGQKQVRLLAFYEALRRLAQTVPPLVVDTPLGRLDKEVRAAVLSRLYLNSDGHQSIVLATNAEIDPDGELFGKVRDQFGKAFTLVAEGKEGTDDYEVRLDQKKYFGKRIG